MVLDLTNVGEEKKKEIEIPVQTPKATSLSIEMHGQDKIIGDIVDVIPNYRVYVTNRKENHFFRMFRSFNISEDVVKKLQEKKVDDVIIVYEGRDFEDVIKNSLADKHLIMLRTPLVKWIMESKTYAYHEEEIQKAVCVYDMDIVKKKKLDEKGEVKEEDDRAS
jgi:hypothetical protein